MLILSKVIAVLFTKTWDIHTKFTMIWTLKMAWTKVNQTVNMKFQQVLKHVFTYLLTYLLTAHYARCM